MHAIDVHYHPIYLGKLGLYVGKSQYERLERLQFAQIKRRMYKKSDEYKIRRAKSKIECMNNMRRIQKIHNMHKHKSDVNLETLQRKRRKRRRKTTSSQVNPTPPKKAKQNSNGNTSTNSLPAIPTTPSNHMFPSIPPIPSLLNLPSQLSLPNMASLVPNVHQPPTNSSSASVSNLASVPINVNENPFKNMPLFDFLNRNNASNGVCISECTFELNLVRFKHQKNIRKKHKA